MDKIIFNIVQAILSPSFVADEGHFVIGQVAEKLFRKIMAMPILLRAAMMVLVYVFNVGGIFVGAKFFENLTLSQRQKQLRQWQNSKVGLCRDVMGFFTKMTLFIYFAICPKKN